MKKQHRHKWRCIGGCEKAGHLVHYARYRCKCGARMIRYHIYGVEEGWIKLKRDEEWEEYEVP